MTPPRNAWWRTAVVTAAALTLAGCTAATEPDPTPSTSTAPSASDVVDPDLEALEAGVDELRATVAALREALESAAAGEDGLSTAAALLVADVAAVTDPDALPDDGGDDAAPAEDDAAPAEDDGATDDAAAADGTQDGPAGTSDDALAPLLPGPRSSRAESVGYGDLLTRLLAASRSAGSAGAGVQRFLADPLAGDLGAWQRAPADQLALVGATGRTSSLDAAGSAILGLTGEAPRALAWVVHGLTQPDAAVEAAGRALAHLAVVELALEQL